MNEISYTAAFIGGFLSFFSPCIIPLLPVYVSLFSGISLTEIGEKRSKIRIILHSLIFILGFSVVYFAIGLGSSLLIGLFHDYQSHLRVIAGSVLVLFGFLLLKVIKSGFLMRDIRIKIKIKKVGTPLTAFLVGFGFAAGWSPCIGPILGSILTYAGMSGDLTKTFMMLGLYCLGLAFPFMLSSILIDTVIKELRKFMKFFNFIYSFIGILIITLGLLMITGIVLPS